LIPGFRPPRAAGRGQGERCTEEQRGPSATRCPASRPRFDCFGCSSYKEHSIERDAGVHVPAGPPPPFFVGHWWMLPRRKTTAGLGRRHGADGPPAERPIIEGVIGQLKDLLGLGRHRAKTLSGCRLVWPPRSRRTPADNRALRGPGPLSQGAGTGLLVALPFRVSQRQGFPRIALPPRTPFRTRFSRTQAL
jgi:hypothetical protein